jgi:hypothetical protein
MVKSNTIFLLNKIFFSFSQKHVIRQINVKTDKFLFGGLMQAEVKQCFFTF